MKNLLGKIKNTFKKLSFKRLGGINSILLVCGVLLIFMVTILFGYGLSSKSLIVASSKEINETYYLMEAGKFSDYSEAKTLASEVQAQGGAGYIYYDEGFRVFWAGYTNKKDAESVRQNNQEANLTIYTLTIKNIDFANGFSQNLNQIFKSNLVCFKNCIQALDSICSQYGDLKKSELEVKADCLILVEEAEQQAKKFSDSFYQDATLYKLKAYYDEFVENLKDITVAEELNADFLRMVRIKLLSCMFCLKKISNTI